MTDRHTPLRLRDAIALFPGIGLTVQTLRTERDKGNLITMMVANKEYVTRAAIEEMFQRCAVTPRGLGSGSDLSAERMDGSLTEKSGSSATGRAKSALAAAMLTAQKLKGSSPATSQRSTARPRGEAL
jgi:hypothetical protein